MSVLGRGRTHCLDVDALGVALAPCLCQGESGCILHPTMHVHHVHMRFTARRHTIQASGRYWLHEAGCLASKQMHERSRGHACLFSRTGCTEIS